MAVITPTGDGRVIDCGGTGRVWGCGCPRCLERAHPLDLMARVSRAQLDEWAAMRATLSVVPEPGICYCGQPGRLYAGGYRCGRHVEQATVRS